MNDIIQNILNRRSVRVYAEEQLKEHDLRLILQAGQYAPSARNSQPWHFTVVQNKELIEKFNLDTKAAMVKAEIGDYQALGSNEKYNIFYQAPTVIFVSGEKDSIAPQLDCAAAAENMMLAAESLGIGSCWIGLVKFLFMGEHQAEYAQLLNIPQGYEPYYALTFGYKKIDNPLPKPRRENTVSYIR